MSEPGREPPSVNSLLIAERVYRDQATGAWIIAGVYNTLRTSRLTFDVDRVDVFFQVTNINKNADLHLCIEHAESGEEVVDLGGPIKAQNPLHVVEQHVIFRHIRFTRDGKYWIQLKSNEEILTQAPLHIIVVKDKCDTGEHADAE